MMICTIGRYVFFEQLVMQVISFVLRCHYSINNNLRSDCQWESYREENYSSTIRCCARIVSVNKRLISMMRELEWMQTVVS